MLKLADYVEEEEALKMLGISSRQVVLRPVINGLMVDNLAHFHRGTVYRVQLVEKSELPISSYAVTSVLRNVQSN